MACRMHRDLQWSTAVTTGTLEQLHAAIEKQRRQQSPPRSKLHHVQYGWSDVRPGCYERKPKDGNR